MPICINESSRTIVTASREGAEFVNGDTDAVEAKQISGMDLVKCAMECRWKSTVDD
jgi:hypothetical protein